MSRFRRSAPHAADPLDACRRPVPCLQSEYRKGFYLNVEVNRPEAARYGLTVGDVQRVITSAVGGANVAQNVEGRERFPINVRYERDFRDDPEAVGPRPDRHAVRRADSDQSK